MFGNPREFRCTGGEIIPLEALCDGFSNCTTCSGEDERSAICESKLYPDSPSETWLSHGLFAEHACMRMACIVTYSLTLSLIYILAYISWYFVYEQKIVTYYRICVTMHS